jgi:hypothetical protein
MARAVLATALVAIGLLCSAAAAAPAKHGVLLGAMTNVADGKPWTRARVLDYERMIGRKLDIDHIFYWTDATKGVVCSGLWPTKGREDWNAANGRINLISWMPDTSLEQTLDGSLDGCISKMARALKRVPGTVLLRWGWEMNGDWYPWSGAKNGGGETGEANFRNAWIHTWTIFQHEGATNVKWVWCPNNGNYPYRGFYPGDRYVDWVAVDGYNWTRSPWLSFSQILASGTASSSVYSDYARRKPFMIAETGSIEDSADPDRKGRWFADAEKAIKARFPLLRALVYFNTIADGADWRIETSRASIAGFRQLALDPYFHTRR